MLDMYLLAGQKMQSPMNRTVNIRSAVQMVISSFNDKNKKMGFLYLFTLGIFGIGWIVDIVKQSLLIYRSNANNTKNSVSYDSRPVNTVAAPRSRSVPVKSHQFSSSVKQELSHIDEMSADGWSFERYTAELLRKCGYDKAEVTSGSNDYGVDVIAEKGGVRFAIQCKCYSNKLNNKPVQEVLAGMSHYNAHVGVVITNNYFTANAIQLAKDNNVLLWDRDKLAEMIEPFCIEM